MQRRSALRLLLGLVASIAACASPSAPHTPTILVADPLAGEVTAWTADGSPLGAVILEESVPAGTVADPLQPSALAVEGGRLLVTSFAAGEVLSFELGSWTFEEVVHRNAPDAPRVEEPCAAAVVGEAVYVLGNDSRNLLVLEADGTVLDELGESQPIRDPHAVVPWGDLLLVATSPSTRDLGLVQVWDPAADARVGHFAPHGELRDGTGLALAPDGRLVVADWIDERLVVYEPGSGRQVGELLGPEVLDGPVSVTFDTAGTLWILDRSGVLRLDPTGLLERVVDAEEAGFVWPRNLAVVPNAPW